MARASSFLAGWLLAAAAWAPAAAQAPEARPLAWEDCVAEALRANPDLASARRGLEAARASYRGSFNGFLPQLSLSNSYNDSEGATGASRWSAAATASLTLFSASEASRIRSAAAAAARAEASLKAASAALRLSLRRAYAELLFAQESVEVARGILGLRERGARLVSLRYQSGRESKGNRLRAEAQRLQAEADAAQAARALSTARRSLARQLGRDAYAVLSATGTLSSSAPPEFPADPSPLLTGRPEIAAAEAALRQARASLGQARSVLWPSLSASYSRSRSGREELPTTNDSWSVSGTLSLPLFAGGPTAAYHGISAASRQRDAAAEDLRAARAQGLLELESVWSDYAFASDSVRVQRALLEAARQRNEEADIRYASGLLSYDNWEIIVSDRVLSERSELAARRQAVVAEAGWDRSLGRGLER